MSAPAEVDVQAAQRKVRGPAIGLLVVGILNLLGLVVAVLMIYSVRVRPAEVPYDMPGPPPARRLLVAPGGPLHRAQAREYWRDAGSPVSGDGLLETLFVLVVPSLLGIATGVLIILGALKMKNLQSYGLAMTASILAMLPCTYAFLIGIPMGIWALVVLTKPEVKAAFARKGRA